MATLVLDASYHPRRYTLYVNDVFIASAGYERTCKLWVDRLLDHPDWQGRVHSFSLVDTLDPADLAFCQRISASLREETP